ncbi:MAG: LysE family transporter [bacterium]|nr:LysE family transporter [bacterium]
MDIFNIILQGLITGVILTLSFGAGFFALVQTSIMRGYKKGLFIALGAIISDTLFIGLAMFATSFISEELPKYAQLIKIIALAAFLLLGIRSILKSSKLIKSADSEGRPNYFYISKGFILNIVNPLVLITWLGITLFLESTLNYKPIELALFFAMVLIGTFASQSAICIFSHKIKSLLSDKFIHRMNISIGFLFIAIGLMLFFNNSDPQMGMVKAQQLLK